MSARVASFRVAVLSSVVILVSGCLGFEPFQPPPDLYKTWEKKGEDDVGIKKALMECGYPNPFGDKMSDDPNESATRFMCMRHDGFRNSNRDWKGLGDTDASRLRSVCSLAIGPFVKGRASRYERLPACEPGAPVRRRDVDRRMNGPFCASYPKADVCTP